MNSQSADRVVVAELQGLLERFAPDESALASTFLDDTESTTRSPESIFGLPGGGIELVLGPQFMGWIAAIAIAFLSRVKDAALKTAADAAVAWVAKRFFHSASPAKVLPEVSATKEQTLERVQAALVAAGWNPRQAFIAAEEVWASGERVSQRLIVLAKS
jgi:hypothetical protein